MNVDPSSEEEPSINSRTPLMSIGLAVFAVLMVPVILFSMGPDGPAKVGDVVFVTDRHRVRVMTSDGDEVGPNPETCVLEPRVQLVVQKMGIPSVGSMIAEPVATERAGRPFCFPGRPIVVYAHQVTLRPDLWGGLRDTFSHLFSGR
ncbi:hypothetical protein [uncultured Nitrospira sp.]|uniref:hypothetical protein n=1 Tax=uncultured Nitrospira sp. TaxID=157176 RepID=UPI0031401DA0